MGPLELRCLSEGLRGTPSQPTWSDASAPRTASLVVCGPPLHGGAGVPRLGVSEPLLWPIRGKARWVSGDTEGFPFRVQFHVKGDPWTPIQPQ